MKRLIATCLLIAGCTSEYERKHGESVAEYEHRALACEEKVSGGEHPFSVVSTDQWRVGATPFWSTAERVRAALGAPDSTFQPLQFEFGPDLEFLSYGRLGEGTGGSIGVTVVNDSLAYLDYAELRSEPLVTDRGRFEPGAPLSEFRGAFPESYQCRDWGTASLDDDQFHPVLVATDTARGAHVRLKFLNEKLYSVGTDYYIQERVHGSVP